MTTTMESSLDGAPVPPVPHPTRAERRAAGKAARASTPFAALDEVSTGVRQDPVALLEQQAASRVPELVPIRYGRMLVSPFTFYRGAALIMAADLASTPNSGLYTQLCGDAHMSNFGVYSSPERTLVFDVNDFDETHPGPFEWDVKRLAASVAVAAAENGFSAKKVRAAVLATVAGYREQMRSLAAVGNLAAWYSHENADDLTAGIGSMLDSARKTRWVAALEKARTRDSVQALAKLTTRTNGVTAIRSDPPLVVPIEELLTPEQVPAAYEMFAQLIRPYRRTLQSDRRVLMEQFHLAHAARKVVGVGSVGTRAWIFLFQGSDDADPLFLQAKEAQTSVLAGRAKGPRWRNQGQRVVQGQHLLQASSDIFLGWQHAIGIDGQPRDFYLRQLRDGKGSVVVETLVPDAMTVYGRVCGQALARGHARGGDRVAIAAYLGSSDRFDNVIADYAASYADQTVLDHAKLQVAVNTGQLTAVTGI
ncbi:MAG TPA: DUF2252 domain-containing protein [Candidatus Nanopelagicales bacterium]|jgi:uncharacterized protein (DUF2252 family)